MSDRQLYIGCVVSSGHFIRKVDGRMTWWTKQPALSNGLGPVTAKFDGRQYSHKL